MSNIAELATPTPTANARTVRLALMDILDSDDFGRAQRMRELLQFLVEKKISGLQRDTHEYAVGIEVFKRDPQTYNTCTDPIVRVQVGRLRERLRLYYAGAGRTAALRFVIPVGSYMPEILSMPTPSAPPPALQSHAAAGSIASQYQLAHCTLSYFDNDALGCAFSRGLNEELVHQLYCCFGATIVPNTSAPSLASASHRLEGSVRLDGGRVRLSLRLVDNSAGSMVWSKQFDGTAGPAIPLQEQLAAAACTALNQYFAHG